MRKRENDGERRRERANKLTMSLFEDSCEDCREVISEDSLRQTNSKNHELLFSILEITIKSALNKQTS